MSKTEDEMGKLIVAESERANAAFLKAFPGRTVATMIVCAIKAESGNAQGDFVGMGCPQGRGLGLTILGKFMDSAGTKAAMAAPLDGALSEFLRSAIDIIAQKAGDPAEQKKMLKSFAETFVDDTPVGKLAAKELARFQQEAVNPETN